MAKKLEVSPPAIAVENSGNRKIGACSATYVTLGSCPPGCSLMDHGCYAQKNFVGLHARHLARSRIHDPLTLARAEARAIRQLTGWRPLRLHVSGDSRTNTGARLVAAAARWYRRQHGAPAWGYTQTWRKVERASWQGVSMLASCHAPEEIFEARKRGYAAAFVADYPVGSPPVVEGTQLVECLYDTEQIPCDQCRLCWDDGRLYQKQQTILFRKK